MSDFLSDFRCKIILINLSINLKKIQKNPKLILMEFLIFQINILLKLEIIWTGFVIAMY